MVRRYGGARAALVLRRVRQAPLQQPGGAAQHLQAVLGPLGEALLGGTEAEAAVRLGAEEHGHGDRADAGVVLADGPGVALGAHPAELLLQLVGVGHRAFGEARHGTAAEEPVALVVGQEGVVRLARGARVRRVQLADQRVVAQRSLLALDGRDTAHVEAVGQAEQDGVAGRRAQVLEDRLGEQFQRARALPEPAQAQGGRADAVAARRRVGDQEAAARERGQQPLGDRGVPAELAGDLRHTPVGSAALEGQQYQQRPVDGLQGPGRRLAVRGLDGPIGHGGSPRRAVTDAVAVPHISRCRPELQIAGNSCGER